MSGTCSTPAAGASLAASVSPPSSVDQATLGAASTPAAERSYKHELTHIIHGRNGRRYLCNVCVGPGTAGHGVRWDDDVWQPVDETDPDDAPHWGNSPHDEDQCECCGATHGQMTGAVRFAAGGAL